MCVDTFQSASDLKSAVQSGGCGKYQTDFVNAQRETETTVSIRHFSEANSKYLRTGFYLADFRKSTMFLLAGTLHDYGKLTIRINETQKSQVTSAWTRKDSTQRDDLTSIGAIDNFELAKMSLSLMFSAPSPYLCTVRRAFTSQIHLMTRNTKKMIRTP
jgi:hypothetical protein